MDEKLINIYNFISMPIVICYVDLNSKDPEVLAESKRMVNQMLPRLAKALYMGMMVCYARVEINGNTRKQFGIMHEKLPAVAFSRSGNFFPYPLDEPLFVDELVTFGTKILKGIRPTSAPYVNKRDTYAIDEILNPKFRGKIEKHFGFLLDNKSFHEKVLAEGSDAVIMIFSSAMDVDYQEFYAGSFADCRKRFIKMGITSVVFYALDVNTNYGIS